MLLSPLVVAALAAPALARSPFGRVHPLRAYEPEGLAARAAQRDAQAEALARRAAPTNSTTKYRYRTAETEPFLVTSLPEVTWNFGELYSGSVAVDANNKTEGSLFFFFSPKAGDPVDEVTIWLNGGPGCSSLEGFIQENGPIIWEPGTIAPVPNPYSWNNLTNVLWVDQPIGTGFSAGTPYATSQEEIAAAFAKFFKNWQDIFGIKNYKIYVTGESYAGRYVPYISAEFINQNNTANFNLSGALMYDPVIGDMGYVQTQPPTVGHVEANLNLWGFNDTFMESLRAAHKSCGYQDYLDKYLVWPASGVQPPPPRVQRGCDLNSLVYTEVFSINPCFNPYYISESCPIPYDILGFPGVFSYSPPGHPPYFTRPDVVKAIHAPTSFKWKECSDGNVFVGGRDKSALSIQKVLPQVIEKTNRVLISNGDFDFVVLTNGTLLEIQNMTWHGQLGFQSPPYEPWIVNTSDIRYVEQYEASGLEGLNGPRGQQGYYHYERGLMWVQTFQAGHMQPEFQPRAGYRHLQWLLGRVEQI
ncbi:hypothetical protein Q8F55_003419 [Vanrija albida]|uniref:Carboxypeptidase n=1 Tax=Vanrija albida TaxID=181172 RepID=A0ABR3Q3Y4_9TREE